MTLDKEEHRIVLLQIIDQAAFPGKFAEDVVALKAAIREARVDPPQAPSQSSSPAA